MKSAALLLDAVKAGVPTGLVFITFFYPPLPWRANLFRAFGAGAQLWVSSMRQAQLA